MNKAKIQADKAAAARKAEEDKAKLLEAIEKSGLSYTEVIDLLK